MVPQTSPHLRILSNRILRLQMMLQEGDQAKELSPVRADVTTGANDRWNHQYDHERTGGFLGIQSLHKKPLRRQVKKENNGKPWRGAYLAAARKRLKTDLLKKVP